MSERRTELIRVRLTPSEKASWEAAAVREDKSVSELIRERMNGWSPVPLIVKRDWQIDAAKTPLALGVGDDRCCANVCTEAENCQHPLRKTVEGTIDERSTPEEIDKLRETFGPKPDAERKSWMFEARGE